MPIYLRTEFLSRSGNYPLESMTQIQRKDLAPKTYSKMTKMLKLPTKDLTAAITTLLSEVNAKWI